MHSNFKFAVLGDSRGETTQINKDVLGKLFCDIKTLHNPNFILFAGDMILGRTTSRVDPTVNPDTKFILSNLIEWENFAKKALNVPSLKNYLFPVIGNHDYSNNKPFKESIEAFNSAFSYLPSYYNREFLPGYGKTVYFFDYGPCRFIMLNTVFLNDREIDKQILYGIDKKQQDWLEAVLKNSNKPNNFVLLHCPIFGTKESYYSLPADQRLALFKIFNKYNVTALYAGHEHSYYRRFITNVFFSDDKTLNAQVTQVTSGCAGAPFETPGPQTLNIIKGPLCIYEYGIIEVCNGVVISKFYDINGNCFDSFSNISRF